MEPERFAAELIRRLEGVLREREGQQKRVRNDFITLHIQMTGAVNPAERGVRGQRCSAAGHVQERTTSHLKHLFPIQEKLPV